MLNVLKGNKILVIIAIVLISLYIFSNVDGRNDEFRSGLVGVLNIDSDSEYIFYESTEQAGLINGQLRYDSVLMNAFPPVFEELFSYEGLPDGLSINVERVNSSVVLFSMVGKTEDRRDVDSVKIFYEGNPKFNNFGRFMLKVKIRFGSWRKESSINSDKVFMDWNPMSLYMKGDDLYVGTLNRMKDKKDVKIDTKRDETEELKTTLNQNLFKFKKDRTKMVFDQALGTDIDDIIDVYGDGKNVIGLGSYSGTFFKNIDTMDSIRTVDKINLKNSYDKDEDIYYLLSRQSGLVYKVDLLESDDSEIIMEKDKIHYIENNSDQIILAYENTVEFYLKNNLFLEDVVIFNGMVRALYNDNNILLVALKNKIYFLKYDGDAKQINMEREMETGIANPVDMVSSLKDDVIYIIDGDKKDVFQFSFSL